MRRELEVRVEASTSFWAEFRGPMDAHIAMSERALDEWPQWMVDAVIAHEYGHWNCWHAEAHLLAIAGFGSLSASVWASDNLAGAMLLLPLYWMLRLLMELQADAWASKHGFNITLALEQLLGMRISKRVKWALELRLANLRQRRARSQRCRRA